MEEVLNYLNQCGIFYVATSDSDQPRVRPFGATAEFEGKLYIVTNNKKNVFKQMLTNPKVEISATNKGTWLRLEAQVVHDSRRVAREKMLTANPSLSSLYSVDDGLIEVLYLKDATATFCSFTAEPKTIKF